MLLFLECQEIYLNWLEIKDFRKVFGRLELSGLSNILGKNHKISIQDNLQHLKRDFSFW